MLPLLAICCLLAATSSCFGIGLNEFERGTLLSNSGPTKMHAGSLMACATECYKAVQCVSFYWEYKPEAGHMRCNLIADMGYYKEPPPGIIIFRPKKYSAGRIVSLPRNDHSWNSAKALCESLNLRLLPAPTTLVEHYIFNHFEGFFDAYYDAATDTATDSDGNVLDSAIVTKYLSPPSETGCLGLSMSNSRPLDCNAAQPYPMQPLCLAP